MIDDSQFHPDSYYVATATGLPRRSVLAGDLRADVCVLGAGYTGLSAALHLAHGGRSVVVLEAERVGFGASGRNGGQLHSGQRRDQEWLEHTVGRDDAFRFWQAGEEAKALVRDLIAHYDIACDYTPGLLVAGHSAAAARHELDYAEKLIRDYGYRHIGMLDRAEMAEALGSSRYFGGYRDRGAAHLHPLNFCLGLARAAESEGARIFEKSRVVRVEPAQAGHPARVVTPTGVVTADDVVLAGNGYLDGIEPMVEARVMPIRNYILATEPLPPEMLARILPGKECAADTRFVVRYWRLSADGRMIFGGGETYTTRDPSDLKGFVRRHKTEVYPELADVHVTHAWGGTLAVTPLRTPLIRRLKPGLYTGTGYCGQGVGTATFAGKILADAILGDQARLDLFSHLPVPPFPGGRLLRAPLLALAMTWYALRDRL